MLLAAVPGAGIPVHARINCDAIVCHSTVRPHSVCCQRDIVGPCEHTSSQWPADCVYTLEGSTCGDRNRMWTCGKLRAAAKGASCHHLSHLDPLRPVKAPGRARGLFLLLFGLS